MELTIQEKEIILQKMWKKRKFQIHPLTTLTGKKVEVLYTGNANFDAGPDFKDAVLKISGILLKGDIEVHLNASSWYDHKHHLNAAYNNVILHLISEDPNTAFQIEREDGVKIEQICIPILKSEVELWKKGDNEFEEKTSDIKIVDDCPLSREKKDKISNTVQVAAEHRFKDKVAQVREELINESWDQILYKKVMEALGYSKNRLPFRTLAELVPFNLLRAEMQWVNEDVAKQRCAALLFGTAGLLPSSTNFDAAADKAESDYVTNLNSLWEQTSPRLKVTPMTPRLWQFFRLRPQNFPTRRIAGMVQIMAKFSKTGFLEGLLNIVYANIDNLRRLTTELELCFIQEAAGFWQSHYSFYDDGVDDKAKNETNLIGKDRAKDILLNIVFPVLYLYAEESNDGRLRNVMHELFRRFPKLAENSITKLMKIQIYGKRDASESASKFAFQQQGLIYLHKLYCNHLRCDECLRLKPDSL